MKMSKPLFAFLCATHIVGCMSASQTNLSTAQKMRLAKTKAFRSAKEKDAIKAKAVQSLLLASAVASVDPECAKKSQTEVAQSSTAPIIFMHSSTNTSAQKATPKRLNTRFKHPQVRATMRHDVVGYSRANRNK
jgi:hypothetical protein